MLDPSRKNTGQCWMGFVKFYQKELNIEEYHIDNIRLVLVKSFILFMTLILYSHVVVSHCIWFVYCFLWTIWFLYDNNFFNQVMLKSKTGDSYPS